MKMPGFSGEASLLGANEEYSAEATREGASAVIPQVICERITPELTRCCELWGADWVCVYGPGMQYQF